MVEQYPFKVLATGSNPVTPTTNLRNYLLKILRLAVYNISLTGKYMKKLKLTPKQLAVIYQFLCHTRLGDINKFESEISDLMITLSNKGIEEYLNENVPILPNISVEFNDSEGLIFNIAG